MKIRQQIVEDHIYSINSDLKIGNINKAFQVFLHSLFIDQSVYNYDVNEDIDG